MSERGRKRRHFMVEALSKREVDERERERGHRLVEIGAKSKVGD